MRDWLGGISSRRVAVEEKAGRSPMGLGQSSPRPPEDRPGWTRSELFLDLVPHVQGTVSEAEDEHRPFQVALSVNK